ncbi:DNA-directed RNA polymerases I and III subunit rpac1 [Babesia sp. Xinjiang]|uniref:DNA-directed RNA polymerases I and III subunit rpac1 n=1 Tax=Babesia sp. Xinjiang TaxID=462227 RepID=UPI000A217F1A|nr:DNA-directed RNA polymerases I and III subunit rpac1 [Babesia sp. Xinjiang]XP_028872066.1 DNA-directed RNA polymerases I and III subunit rpac1 [Babesia sp. Xinjiang]ORM41570.1 DNA-directed RNA polymerases I and III subunit rpac1 [Babesia sp. Xinjiang]ORM41610.1 DNA-directed RNA polymerases I and III subunit rpac1 [Babesia sp. Xinjiang]
MPGNVRLEAAGVKPTFTAEGDSSGRTVLEEIKGIKIKFLKNTRNHAIAEIEGLNVAIANAIRRILIAEVPTLAIETVHIYQNTGVLQDEVLAHRIGLVPFNCDPDMIPFRNNDDLSDKNSVCFQLKVKCTREELGDRTNMPIYARDLKWVPLSSEQAEAFRDNPPMPIYGDILLTKLSAGQEIDLKAYLEKGIGKTHTKWSPVCTAVYRFKPEITFSKEEPLTSEEVEELVNICPMGVFASENGRITEIRPYNCTSCRACVERFPRRIIITKLCNHFIFSVESTGAIPSGQLFLKAIEVLKEKTLRLKRRMADSISYTP